jgi:formylglycine-generating enzyme required for sulfatase activity
VSVGNYTLCVNAMMPGCTAPAVGNYFVQGREQHPINDVTLEQASAFCAAIGARLPSALEQQWAAQGGPLQSVYPWGDSAPSAADQPPRVCAFATDNPDTCAVGGRSAGEDPWGVRDLSGNVAEIVTTAAGACVAGGSYAAVDASELSANACVPYTAESLTIGFRCALDHP